MAFTHTLTRGWSNDGASISKRVSATAGSEINIDEIIPGLSTALPLDVSLSVANLKSFFLVAAVDMDLAFLAGGVATANTLSVTAEKPISWIEGDATFSDLSGVAFVDFDEIQATVAGDVDGLLQIRILSDPTP